MALPVKHKPLQPADQPPAFMMEKHFTVTELAEQWGYSYDFVFDRFRDEPGVVSSAERGARRRTRTTLRIPESVAARVYARMVIT